MASDRSAVITGAGDVQEARDADTQIVSGTLTTFTGQQLTILSATSPIVLGSDTTVANTKVLDVTNGNAKLNLQFWINGVATSVNVTAAHVNTLVDGGDATALHYHSSSAVGGLTLWSTPVAGEIGVQTATNNTLTRAKATSMTLAAGVAGVYSGVAGSVTPFGGQKVQILFEAGLNTGTAGAPTANQPLYLSATVDGRATNNSPTASGNVSLNLGYIADASGYNNATGSVLWCWARVGLPILRA